jgi:tetratricopeptide (TPR) repeat protein
MRQWGKYIFTQWCVPAVIVCVVFVLGSMYNSTIMYATAGNREMMAVEQKILDTKSKLFAASLRADRSAITEAEKEFVMVQAIASAEQRALTWYYIGYARLSVSNLCIEDEKELNINRAIAALEQCVHINKEFADGFALLSAAYGQKAGLGLFSAMQFGLKSNSMMDKALALAPENPRVQMLYGVATYYKPGIVGGSKKKGIEILRKANQLFVAQASAINEQSLLPTWGMADSFAWLGVVAMDAGDKPRAKHYLDRALTIAPNYTWVKTELYAKLSS